MNRQELSALTDEELLLEAKKMRSTTIINAVFVGLMIGIVIYSVLKSTIGLLTLILLYLAYRIMNNSKNNEELEKLLKERNLK